jgi:catechol 2,3-dioxygenase-like lactoylglutathione lyase family enzyme
MIPQAAARRVERPRGGRYRRRRMLSHVSVGVTDLARAVAFYDAALGALGYVRVFSGPISAGWGTPDGTEPFAVKLQARPPSAGPGSHLAFGAPSPAAVDRFHAEALRHGAVDDGGPGERPEFGPTYYAAFVFDPDGNRHEAVHQ